MSFIPKLASNGLTSSGTADASAAVLGQSGTATRGMDDTITAATAGRARMQGYLTKHRPLGQLSGLFAQEWELRYFVLKGTELKYYKNDRDTARAPRGVVDIQGCCIEIEDPQQSNTWRLRLLEPGGNLVLRLGADSRDTAQQWLQCFEAVGVQVSAPSEHTHNRGADPGNVGTLPRGGYGHYTPEKEHDRWEACSTDSELPETPRNRRSAAAARPPRPPGRHQANPSQTAAAAAAAAAVAEATTRPAHSSTLVSRYAAAAAAVDEISSKPSTTSSSGLDNVDAQNGDNINSVGPLHPAVGDSRPHPPTPVTRPPMLGSTPVHTVSRYSYLSSDGVWMARHDGLLNLGIIILVATNFRLILENLLKYGVRLNFISYVSRSLSGKGNLPLVLAFPALLLFSLVGLCIEKLGVYCLRVEQQYGDASVKKSDGDRDTSIHDRQAPVRRTEVVMFLLNVVNTSAALLLPCCVIHWTQAAAAPGFLLTLCTLVVWMKLVSYAHCHHDLRAAHRAQLLRPGERGAPHSNSDWARLRYPENLTVGNMLYFLAAPTLTYQVNYPRSPRIRKRWLLRRVVELACFSGLLLFMVNQYLEPAVANAVLPLSESDWVRVLERVLKLALPMLYCWLCIFYCLFHLFLNITAELTRFGDREFYKDWWNAATIGDYWKTWNMPVHKWLLRTIYFPAMRAGLGRYRSLVLVFFVSAVAHEVAVGVPLHMVKFWSFAGIMLQVPLISLTENLRKRLKSETWGNYIFWVTFCMVGQPVSLLMYYHDYVFANHEHGRAPLTAVAASRRHVCAGPDS